MTRISITQSWEISSPVQSATFRRTLRNLLLQFFQEKRVDISFTIIFMLVALTLLGGTTVKWFAIALLIGTVSGTYSSPFVAVPILVTWDELQGRLRRSKFFF